MSRRTRGDIKKHREQWNNFFTEEREEEVQKKLKFFDSQGNEI